MSTLVLPHGITTTVTSKGQVIVSTSRMSEADYQALRNAYWINAAQPRMVIAPTYESYRHTLYGWPERDWFLVLNYGLLAALLALVFAILYAVGLTA